MPGRGAAKQECVVKQVKEMFPAALEQPSVHRLDMDTSGLMVLALTQKAHKTLSLQFQERQVHKIYIALLDGMVSENQGEITLPFRLDPNNRPFQIYDPVHGKWGTTQWRRLNIEEQKTRIEFTPVTGRTHQLRLHSSHPQGLDCPIIGDRLYGSGKEGDQLMLHAAYLSFQHPESGKQLKFSSEIPF